MHSITTLTIGGFALGLPLLAAVAAHAGPGSVPNHLLPRQTAEKRPAYALTGDTGRARDERGWTAESRTIGGTRDQRTVFVPGTAR